MNIVNKICFAGVAELADAQDLKSCGAYPPYRFDPGLRHQTYFWVIRCERYGLVKYFKTTTFPFAYRYGLVKFSLSRSKYDSIDQKWSNFHLVGMFIGLNAKFLQTTCNFDRSSAKSLMTSLTN